MMISEILDAREGRPLNQAIKQWTVDLRAVLTNFDSLAEAMARDYAVKRCGDRMAQVDFLIRLLAENDPPSNRRLIDYVRSYRLKLILEYRR